MMDASKAIKIEKQHRKSGGPRKVYVFECAYDGCKKQIKIRADALKTSTGFCQTHSHVKRPYESIFNGLFRDHRKPVVELTYEEFCQLAEIKNCHYCGESILRMPYATVEGVYGSRAYFLDKKNSLGPYSLSNCVVCCTSCNRIKGNSFSYEEFLIIGNAIRQVKDGRTT